MDTLPKTTFSGYLKQLSVGKLSERELALFDMLFPQFRSPLSVPTTSYLGLKQKKSTSGDLATLQRIVALHSRRFSGIAFPENRYYTLSKEYLGRVDQTLAHELRAYRNPRDVGYCDVLDICAKEVILGFETSKGKIFEEFVPENAIAVIVHDFDKMPKKLQRLCIKTFRLGMNNHIGLFKFPYENRLTKIEGVIDLRFPFVRDWFFKRFANSAEEYGRTHVKSFIANSRFHLESGIPRQVKSFWDMLPTLVNPILGGGHIDSTGSTLQYIAHTLQHESVAAFIYPSARADVMVTVENGEISDFEGWNLVDYRNITERFSGAKVHTVDQNPWCWQSLPSGAVLKIAPVHDKLDGSFSIAGIVDYSAMHYIQQCDAVKQIKLRTPELFERGILRHFTKPYIAWQLGSSLNRWIRSAYSSENFKQDLMDTFGYATLLDVYDIVGRIDDLAKTSSKDWVNDALTTVSEIGAAISTELDKHGYEELLSGIFILATNLELSIFYLSWLASMSSSKLEIMGSPDGLHDKIIKEVKYLVGVKEKDKSRLTQFFLEYEGQVKTKRGNPELLKQGIELSFLIENQLRNFCLNNKHISIAYEALQHFNRGLDFASRNRHDEAIKEFKIALKYNPESAELHNNLAVSLSAIGSVRRAIKEFEEAITLNPNDALPHHNIGVELHKKGSYKKAIERYKMAIELNPKYGIAHNNLAGVLSIIGKVDEAISESKIAININPKDSLAHHNLGALYLKKGMYGEALEEFTIALSTDPENALLHYNLGVAYERLHNPEKAKIAFMNYRKYAKPPYDKLI